VGWLLPLGSHKVLGCFAGYLVSVSLFEIVRLFFQRLFVLMLRFDGLPFWTFILPRLRTSYSLPSTYHSTFLLPQDFLDVNFLLRPCLLFRTPEDFFFYDQPEAVLFFLCLKKTCDVWRRLVMPEEAFHTTRHRPRRRHHESSLVAPRTPIWLAHSHFAWQTKLWLSEDVSVRFNQNLLKQCTHKYYIRLSG